MRRPVAWLVAGMLLAVGLAACSLPGDGGRITVTAWFSDVNALEHHATVEMNGITVGRVSHIATDGVRARLTLSLTRSSHVPANAVPVIRTPSLLATEVVELQVPPGPAAGPLQDHAVLADAVHPARLQPDLETLVKAGNDLLGTLGAAGTSALAQVISENAQGFGPEGADLRAVLDNLNTVVTGYAGQTGTIDTLLHNLDTFASGVGPAAQADAQALSNLAGAVEVLDRQKDRLVDLLNSLNNVSTQGSQLLNADLARITDQLTGLASVTRALADQQNNLARVVQYLNGHNLSTFRGVDRNDDFTQVLNDFIICGLPGGGEVPNDPVNSCSRVP